MKVKTIYFNMKTNFGVETVDQCISSEYENNKAYNAEIKSMLSNYHLAGMDVYLSSRCTKDWKNN